MKDQRIEKIARLVLTHSVKIKKGERVYIDATEGTESLVKELVDTAYALGAEPYVYLQNTSVSRKLMIGANAEQLVRMGENLAQLLEKMDCYVGISAPANSSELMQVSQECQSLYNQKFKKFVSSSKKKLRWVSLTMPNVGMAQNAGMSLDEFEDYYFTLMTMDYSKLERASMPMAMRMRAADKIRIVAPGTDLTVSLKGYTALIAAGEHNLPDGEIASTPVRNSINGTIAFNIPSMHNGFIFKDVVLTFKDGKVVDVKANDKERFLKEISVDDNAHYIGEFSMGTNPYVCRHINDTLFDEKMSGSMHMALGCCYNFPGRDNGNYSAIHWDLIQSHRPEYGGGEVWIDGELIRKDGIYIPEDLRCLNPDEYEKFQ